MALALQPSSWNLYIWVGFRASFARLIRRISSVFVWWIGLVFGQAFGGLLLVFLDEPFLRPGIGLLLSSGQVFRWFLARLGRRALFALRN